jgi:DNA integrity scanning protein DisA with diadenylate cyclase activity
MMRSTLHAMLLLLAMPPVFAFPVSPVPDPVAGSSPLGASQQNEQRQPAPATLEEAIEIAVERYGGRPAGAETVVRDGQRVHEIKVLNEENGSVRTVRIDPETGAIIPPQR